MISKIMTELQIKASNKENEEDFQIDEIIHVSSLKWFIVITLILQFQLIVQRIK